MNISKAAIRAIIGNAPCIAFPAATAAVPICEMADFIPRATFPMPATLFIDASLANAFVVSVPASIERTFIIRRSSPTYFITFAIFCQLLSISVAPEIIPLNVPSLALPISLSITSKASFKLEILPWRVSA